MGRLIKIDLSFIKNGQNKGTFRVGVDIALSLHLSGEKVVCLTGCKQDQTYLNKLGLKTEYINIGTNKYLSLAIRWIYFKFAETNRSNSTIFVGTHKLSRKKGSIAVIHDLYIKDLPSNYRLDQRFYYKYISIPNAMSGKIIVLTQHLKERLVKEFMLKRENIFVYNYMMHIGLGKAMETRRNEKVSTSVLIVSSAVKNKNINEMPTVLKLLSQNILQKLRIYIVSKEGSIESTLKINSAEALESVVTLGDVSDKELMELYTKCCYYLTTSTIEGFGLGTREAYFHKCIIICPMSETNKEASCGNAIFYTDKRLILESNIPSKTRQMEILKAMEYKNTKIKSWLHR